MEKHIGTKWRPQCWGAQAAHPLMVWRYELDMVLQLQTSNQLWLKAKQELEDTSNNQLCHLWSHNHRSSLYISWKSLDQSFFHNEMSTCRRPNVSTRTTYTAWLPCQSHENKNHVERDIPSHMLNWHKIQQLTILTQTITKIVRPTDTNQFPAALKLPECSVTFPGKTVPRELNNG